MSPEEQAAYWASRPVTHLGDIDVPTDAEAASLSRLAADTSDVVNRPAPPVDAPPSYDYWGGARDVSAERSLPPDANPIFTSAVTAPTNKPIIGYNHSAFGDVPIYGEPAKPAPAATTGAPSPSPLAPIGPPDIRAEKSPLAPIGPPNIPDKPAATPASRAAAYYGGGGGAPAGPSEYSKAMKGLRGTYDTDKTATQAGAEAEKARADVIAIGSAALAQQKIDDQAIQQMEAQNAARHFADYSEETQRQIDDVRAKRIEPNRAYADSGSAALAIIGGVLGGLYQGLNKLEKNPFIEQMNKTIDRDIAAQEHDIRTQKEGIGERRNLLAEMKGTYKDESLAKLQARNLYYEGAKDSIAAQAANFDSPTIQARADQAISALTREQSKLDLQEAIRKAAAAQAAAGAAAHREELRWKHELELDKSRQGWAELGIKAEGAGMTKGSNDVARFVGTGKDADGNPTGYLERNAESAKERETATGAAEKLLKQLNRVQEIRNRQGTLGRVASEAVHGAYTTQAENELAVLESDMTTNAAQAAHLGALSESDRGLMRAKFRDLNAPGSGPDERLDEIRRITEAGLAAEKEAASGARATKVVGPDGRERVIIQGTSNALNNQRAVPRTPVK